MVEAGTGAHQSIAIRRECMATFVKLTNENTRPRGLVDLLRRRQSSTPYVSSDLEMHFVLLPYERQFGMSAATFKRWHDSGELLNHPIPDKSTMVTFRALVM